MPFAYRSAILPLLVILPATIAQAQTLWKGTHYGMGYDQVLKLFPDAQDGSMDLNGHRTVGPLITTTAIEDYHFEVHFMFSAPDGKLSKVSLRCSDRLMNSQGASIGRHFVELLNVKYGQGKIGPNANSSDPNDIEMVWISTDKTQITLSYFADIRAPRGTYRMEIRYDGGAVRGSSDL